MHRIAAFLLRRRRFRISLRVVLLLVTAFCVVFGSFALRAQRQRDAIGLIERHGYAMYRWQLDDAKPPGPAWLYDLFGPEYIHSIDVVGIQGSGVTDISPVAALHGLRLFFAGENRISDLSPLTELTSLELIHLFENDIADISPLANLTQVYELHLSGNPRLKDISPLKNLHRLRDVMLNDCAITDLSPLLELPNLEFVYVDGNPVDGRHVMALRRKGVVVDLGDDDMK